MELRMIKPSLKYVPGQWLFIQVPDISRYQWHPVSPSSLRSRERVRPIYTSPLSFSLLLPLRQTTPMFLCTSAKLETGLKLLENVLVQDRL